MKMGVHVASPVCRGRLLAAAVPILVVVALMLAFSLPSAAQAAAIVAPYDGSGHVWGDTETVGAVLFNTGNKYGVSRGPTVPATFTTLSTYTIISITNYHYGSTADPGSIGLVDADGKTVGSWLASGSSNNYYWYVWPNLTIGPGTYTVVDSNPSTWSYASVGAPSDNMGFTRILVSTGVAPVDTTFTDVSATNPYYAAISAMAGEEIINGYPDGTFGPDKLVLRKHFAKMIVGAMGLAVTENDWQDANPPFADCGVDDSSSTYPHDFIAVAKANGLTQGKTATTFAPDANITRAQMVTMVVRAAQNFGITLDPVSADYAGAYKDYSDPTHGTNVHLADHNGLLEGLVMSGSAPSWMTGNATRGEVAQVLFNLMQMRKD